MFKRGGGKFISGFSQETSGLATIGSSPVAAPSNLGNCVLLLLP